MKPDPSPVLGLEDREVTMKKPVQVELKEARKPVSRLLEALD